MLKKIITQVGHVNTLKKSCFFVCLIVFNNFFKSSNLAKLEVLELLKHEI